VECVQKDTALSDEAWSGTALSDTA